MISVVLFIHVVSAMGLFAAIGVEVALQAQLARARTTAEVKGGLDGYAWVQRIGGPSMILAVLSGAYLASTVWSWRLAWVLVALVGIVVVGAIGGRMTGVRVAQLQKLGPAAGPSGFRDPALRFSLVIRVFILAGIVFLMTVKPTLVGAIAALATAILLGLLAGLPAYRRAKVAA